MKILKLIITFAVLLHTTACNTKREIKVEDVLTSTKWQMTDEKGLNLQDEALTNNIIEFTKKGSLIYYEDKENVNKFTETQWRLSRDENKIIEVLSDNSEIESEIVEINKNRLRLKYHDEDEMGKVTTVIETYEKFEPRH
jgi:hypothetical protein